jgi:hypothetical protein
MRTVLVVASLTVVLAGCGLAPHDRHVLRASAIGAGAGAAVSAASGGNLLLGAAVGSAVGGTVAFFIRPEGCFYRNPQGEFWQVPCEAKIVGAPACYYGNDIVGYEKVDCRRRLTSRAAVRTDVELK